jgi:hypothetical protein
MMATTVRLHWFWRGAIAVLFGGGFWAALVCLHILFGEWFGRLERLLEHVLPPLAAFVLVLAIGSLVPCLG